MNNIEYPIRINKYLALKKYSSRREADEAISKGRVRINGRTARLGDKVEKDDKVEYISDFRKSLVYIAYNKPKGIVTHSPEKDQKDIKSILRSFKDIFPLGRLDRASHGLIILTNDGRVTDRLLNPKYDHEKEYVVRVDKPIDGRDLSMMEKGIWLEDFQTKPCMAKKTKSDEFNIVITEGKKHQIRRMCEKFGYVVKDLKRVRVMNIKIENLKPGEFRILRDDESVVFLKSLGL